MEEGTFSQVITIGDVIGLCISIKGRHQRGLSSSLYNYSQHHQLTELISGTPNDDFLLNTSKTLFRLHIVLLDFQKYILSCAIKFVTYLFGHPRGTCVFSKLLGLQNYFPKKFRCNLSFYECKNFSISYLNHIFESEDFRSPFFYEKQHYLGSEMWKTKLQKIVGNLPGR